MLKIAIVNDTSGFNHFGCDLVMSVYRKQFKARGVDVIGTIPTGADWQQYKHSLMKADLIVVNGEGSIHHGNHRRLIDIAGEFPSVLVNAVYQDMPENDNLGKFEYISVRESFSAKEVDAEIVPDLMFASGIERPEPVGDRVVIDSICRSYGISPHNPKLLEIIGRAREMVTGRFHGACLALLWGMPFSAYPSNTHKTLGMMTDAGCEHLYFETQAEAMENVQAFDGSEYVQSARQKINQMFDKICS